MSTTNAGTSTLLRWRPAIIGLTVVAAGLSIYYVRQAENDHTPNNSNYKYQQEAEVETDEEDRNPGLHRSNAIRRRSPRLRHARASIADVTDRVNDALQATPEAGFGAHGTQRDDDDFSESGSQAGGGAGAGGAGSGGGDGQSLLNILYHIAEEQAAREGYVHRGVTCNSCNVLPIRGIRYRCANCPDYDLCEQCENLGVHEKTHLFYKIRVPAPFLGANPRQQQPVWYPGKPYGLPRTVPRELKKRLSEETGFERSHIDALWDQFKSLASRDWDADPSGLGVAIDRKVWAKYCIPPLMKEHEVAMTLLFDRSFTFYDDNDDGLVGFEEFLTGLAAKQSKNPVEKIKRTFRAHDLDKDGFISRQDMMTLFTGHYTYMKELSRDMVHIMEEEVLEGPQLKENLQSTQPVSSCFNGSIPHGESSRIGEGKTMTSLGDLVVTDGGTFLREFDDGLVHEGEGGSDTGEDEKTTKENGTAEPRQGTMSNLFKTLGQPMPDWPPAFLTLEDVKNALNKNVPLQSITSASDQQKVLDAAHARAERQRQKATVNGVAPQTNGDYASHDESPRSSPGAKGVSPTLDVQANEDSGSNEADDAPNQGSPISPTTKLDPTFAREYLYQISQEGLNELLDPIFKHLEDLMGLYERTRNERKRLATALQEYKDKDKNLSLCIQWLQRTLREWRIGERESAFQYGEEMAQGMLDSLMGENKLGSDEWMNYIMDRISLGVPEEEVESILNKVAQSKLDNAESICEKIRVMHKLYNLDDDSDVAARRANLRSGLGECRAEAKGTAGAASGSLSQLDGQVVHVSEELIQSLLSGEDFMEQVENDLETFDSGADRADDISRQDLDTLLSAAGYSVNTDGSAQVSDLPNNETVESLHRALFEDVEQINGPDAHGPETEADIEELFVRATNGRDEDRMQIEPTVDPTLPQHRPDRVDSESGSAVGPSSQARNKNKSHEPRHMRWSHVNMEGTLASMEQHDPYEDRDSEYFLVKLKYLTILDLVAEQAKVRGGPSRINAEEFLQIMTGNKAQDLGIIGTWLDLAAF